jgi:hypothetical protein
MKLPQLRSEANSDTTITDSVLFAVYASFGSDPELSTFPDGNSSELIQHPLVTNLMQVAASGVNVMALIDRAAEDTYLVQIPAGLPEQMQVTSRWKQTMESPYNLAGFLRHAAQTYPESRIVLALEGHGAGFLPDLDVTKLTPQNVTQDGSFEWLIEADQTAPQYEDGTPVLGVGFPDMPAGSPQFAVNHMPMSTFGLGYALQSAISSGVPKLAVIHFNNCFNMSAELLHTVAPYAEYAAGYINYNFFSSGGAYPAVFEKLQEQGAATAKELSSWFALNNQAFFAPKGNHPTVGASIELARMRTIVQRVHELSSALLAALTNSSEADRATYIGRIEQAISRAQHFDMSGNMLLQASDQMIDLRSLSHELQAEDFGSFAVVNAAKELEWALQEIKQYGDSDEPWTLPSTTWDFSTSALAMNILFPDPLRQGLWDWRSPYYMNVYPTEAQPNIIDFLKITDWVKFLIEYHREVKFVGLLSAVIPTFPVFNAKYEPPRDDPKDPPCPPPPPCDPPKDPPK